MKIVIVCDILGEVNNGTTLATVNLIKHLKSKGYEITVVSPDQSTSGLENYYVVPQLNLGKFLNGIVHKNGACLAKADKSVLLKAIKDADVIQVQIPLLLGCAAVKIARQLGKPITASFHCQAENISAHLGLMNCTPFNKLIYKKFYRQVYKYCDRVHYPTEFIRRTFEDNTHPTNAFVISNGVSEEFFKPLPKQKISDKFVIVCSGRYSKEKAQWQLIKAVAHSKHRKQIKIILAGAGPYDKSLAKLAQKLSVDCEMKFFKRKDLIPILQNADLYVHTAIIEIEAIACMEAIVSGLVPVICDSDRSATRFFALDRRNLFKPKDIDDLTHKIDFFFEHEDIKKKYAEKYRGNIDSFSLHNCMEQMEKMIVGAAEEAKQKS